MDNCRPSKLSFVTSHKTSCPPSLTPQRDKIFRRVGRASKNPFIPPSDWGWTNTYSQFENANWHQPTNKAKLFVFVPYLLMSTQSPWVWKSHRFRRPSTVRSLASIWVENIRREEQNDSHDAELESSWWVDSGSPGFPRTGYYFAVTALLLLLLLVVPRRAGLGGTGTAPNTDWKGCWNREKKIESFFELF